MAEAHPPLALDAASTAIVIVDLQNGIAGRPELAPHSGADVTRRSIELANVARSKGALIVWVRVLLHELLTRPADAAAPAGAVPPKEASEFVAAVTPEEGDEVVLKRCWGAFFGTQLEQVLRRKAVKIVVLAGIATNYGVESTAREAFDRGYDLVFAEDATTTMGAELHKFAVERIFPRMGRVRSAEAIAAALT